MIDLSFFSELTHIVPSQTKLLDLYIRRHQQAAAAHNGPKR